MVFGFVSAEIHWGPNGSLNVVLVNNSCSFKEKHSYSWALFTKKNKTHLHLCIIFRRAVIVWLNGTAPLIWHPADQTTALLLLWWTLESETLQTARSLNIYKRIQICQFTENANSLCCADQRHMGCYGCVILSFKETPRRSITSHLKAPQLNVAYFTLYDDWKARRLICLNVWIHICCSLIAHVPLSLSPTVSLSQTSEDSPPIREWRTAGS